MHGRLGHAGGARGEGEQAGVVGRRIDVDEGGGLTRHRRFQAIGRGVVEAADAHRHGGLPDRIAQRISQPRIAQGEADLALGQDLPELLGAQQRHGGHGDRAHLHHREPTSRQHRVVGRAQQHAVAGHHAHLVHEHVGDAVGVFLQVGVGPAQAARRPDAQAIALAGGDAPVEQLGRAIEPRWKLQRRQIEAVDRLELRRRQAIAGERVEVGTGHSGLSVAGGGQGAMGAVAGAAASWATLRSRSRAMMSCCTSVAPS